jgi:hypothetical protein
MEEKEAIKLWKELGVELAKMSFSCGGDSMNDTEWTLEDKDGNNIKSSELIGYLDNEVYRHISFYEASDGHYMGEFGTVEVELFEDTEDIDDAFFSFHKYAQSEWEEALYSETELELTEDEANYIKEFVGNINGGEGELALFNYKIDFIKTDEIEALEKSITKKVDDFTVEFKPKECNDLCDFYTYESDCGFNGNSLVINMTNYDYLVTDSVD